MSDRRGVSDEMEAGEAGAACGDHVLRNRSSRSKSAVRAAPASTPERQQDAAVISPFDWLPDELLECVLRAVGSRWVLTTTPAVCMRWYRLSRNVPVRLRLWVKTTRDYKNDSLPYVQSVYPEHEHLPGRLKLFDRWVDRDVETCLEHVASKFPYLACFPNGCPLSVDAWIRVLRVCPNLRHFSAAGVIEPGSQRLIASVAELCPRLMSVEVQRACATDECVALLAKGCRNLQDVSCVANDAITDASLISLATSCPRLRLLKLSFRNCQGITDVGLEVIAKNCAHLNSVEIEGTPQITDRGLIALAKNCPGLDTANFYFETDHELISDIGIQALARNCPRLTSVCVWRAVKVTNVGLIELAKRCPNLRELTFFGTAVSTKGVSLSLAMHRTAAWTRDTTTTLASSLLSLTWSLFSHIEWCGWGLMLIFR
jgi:hypothetical protein